MKRKLLLMLGLALGPACKKKALSALAPPEAELVAKVDRKKVGKGESIDLFVQAWSSPGWTVTPGRPKAEGLTVSLEGTHGPSVAGDRTVTTWHYKLTGPDGSYVIEPGKGSADGPKGQHRELSPDPIFVDIGVDGPTGGPMAAFQKAPPSAGPPWRWIAGGGAGALLLFAAGAGIWRWRRKRPEPPAEPDPPHVLAQRAWAQARAANLDDQALALELSRILRDYLEAITGWPASARTTREILRYLEQNARLGSADRHRAARVLDATDLLKFAGEGGGAAFFAACDADFLAIIEATRPAPPEAAHA